MKKIFLLSFVVSMFFAGCAKDDSSTGCTDQAATNYNADATENCCCNYKGDVVFHYGQAASNRLKSQASYQLTFYVDKVKVGTYPSSKFWNGVPPCNGTDVIAVSKDLGDVKEKTYDYMVVDEVGKTIWSGKMTWKAGSCTPLELK
ncbi:MAG: hypothetical protein ACXWEY_08945 [Bacteroidia bacterium]